MLSTKNFLEHSCPKLLGHRSPFKHSYRAAGHRRLRNNILYNKGTVFFSLNMT